MKLMHILDKDQKFHNSLNDNKIYSIINQIKQINLFFFNQTFILFQSSIFVKPNEFIIFHQIKDSSPKKVQHSSIHRKHTSLLTID
jgi:hypothetical protein